MPDWDADRAAHWAEYNADRADHDLRPLAADVIRLAGPGDGRLAVDLGAGAGVEAAALLAAGWRVLAVDGDATTVPRIEERAGAARDRLEVRVATYGDLGELPPCDLVYSGYSLPYAAEALGGVMAAVRSALRPGGWFAAHLFGDRDSFNGVEPGAYLSRAEAEALLAGWDVVQFTEEDADGPMFGGTKHWHVYHVVARVPGG